MLGDDRHLMEIVFGPATREQADGWTIEVQRLLDERFPAMSAAVGVRYGIDSRPSASDRVDTEPAERGIEAAAKHKWMRAHSHAPTLVSAADLEQMWLDWRGLEIDAYLALLSETREEVVAYLHEEPLRVDSEPSEPVADLEQAWRNGWGSALNALRACDSIATSAHGATHPDERRILSDLVNGWVESIESLTDNFVAAGREVGFASRAHLEGPSATSEGEPRG
jgi:hypothetical protein